MDTTYGKKKISLLTKLIIGVLLVAAVGLGLYFIIITTIVRRELYESSINNLRNNNETHASEIEEYFSDAGALIETMATTWSVVGVNYEQIHNVHRQLIEQIPQLSNIYFGFSDAREGDYYYVVGGLNAPQNFFYDTNWIMSQRPWFSAAQANRGQIITTNPFLCAVQGVLITTTAKYYTDIDGREGAMAFNIYLSVLFEMIEAHEVIGGGYMFVVGPEGQIFTHPNDDFTPHLDRETGITHFTNLSHIPALSGLSQVISRGEYLTRMPNIDGTDTYFLPYRMETTGWTLVTAVPASAVNAPVNTIIFLILGWATFLLSCVMIASIVYMAILIKRTVHGYIRSFQSASMALAQGMSISTNEDTSESFGLGEISKEFNQNLVIMSNLINDISFMYTQRGDAKFTIDSSGYHGSFKGIIELINSLLIQNTNDIMSLADVLNQMSSGDFSVKLTVEDWPGDWQILPNSVNGLTNNLRAVSTEIGELIKAAADKGDLSYQIDATSYQGEWQEIMQGLNSIAKAVHEPLKVIEMSITEMQAGNFDLVNIDNKIAAAGLNADSESYKGTFRSIVKSFDSAITDIASYINEVQQVLALMEKGDLRNKIERKYVGSFDLIKHSVNEINDTLHKTMYDITLSSEQVLEGANKIATSASTLANGTLQQASSIQELNAAVDEISHQTRQNADNVMEANEFSNRSTSNAQEGSKSMNEMLDAMTHIKDSSNAISKIIKVIEEIAFQTNLLALNAAVEAARAGEHGRGFSVVAEEVRSLAVRSQTSATETTELIEDSINRVGYGANIAHSTSKSLETIVKNASEVRRIINIIADASNQQADAITQVGLGLEQISKVVHDNSAVSEQTSTSAEELASQAEALKQMVAYFKL